jgi:hypothetical protein
MISTEAVKEALQGDIKEFLKIIPNLVIFTEAVAHKEHVHELFQRLLQVPELLATLVSSSKSFDVLAQLEATTTGSCYQKSLFTSLLTNERLFAMVTKDDDQLYMLHFAIDRAVRKSRITKSEASNLRKNLITKLLEQPDKIFFKVFHPDHNSFLEQLESGIVGSTCRYYPEAAQALIEKEFDLVFPLIINQLTDELNERQFSRILRLLWDESEDMYLRYEIYTPRIYNKYRELMLARMSQLHNAEYQDWISEHLKCLSEHAPREITPHETNNDTVTAEQAKLLASSVSKVFGEPLSEPTTPTNSESLAGSPLIPPSLKQN